MEVCIMVRLQARGLTFWLVCLALLIVPPQIFGQSITGDILGTVYDSTKAVVPGAKVILTATDTGIKQEAPSDENGNYLVCRAEARPLQRASFQGGFPNLGSHQYHPSGRSPATGGHHTASRGRNPNGRGDGGGHNATRNPNLLDEPGDAGVGGREPARPKPQFHEPGGFVGRGRTHRPGKLPGILLDGRRPGECHHQRVRRAGIGRELYC